MEQHGLLSSAYLSVAVAVNGRKSSRDAVMWALDKFVPEGRILFFLFHVRQKTPPANSQAGETAGAAQRKEAEWERKLMVHDYRRMCEKRQVQMELVLLDANDVAKAISDEVKRRGMDKLVVGASSGGIFSRKLGSGRLSSKIAQAASSVCEVYVISKGRLSCSFSEVGSCGGSDDKSGSSGDSRNFYSDTSIFSVSEFTDSEPPTTLVRSHDFVPLAIQRDRALKIMNQSFHRSPGVDSSFRHSFSRSMALRAGGTGSPSNRLSDFYGAAGSPPATEDEVSETFELERLRIELGHRQQMFEKAQSETIDVSHELSELSSRCKEEEDKLRQISTQEEEARKAMRGLKQKREEAEREARHMRECAELEAAYRKDAEKDAVRDAEEKRRLEKLLLGSAWRYRVFDWEEVLSATASLSDERIIGRGASGTVYLGTLRHTKVAVKVLRSNETHQTRQFKQELEVLGGIRHPHLLLLLGACPDRGCLVYEYMEKGSLEERLRRRRRGDHGQPLRWQDRFRIAWEVGSALAFLHGRPEPIVHRDLKPANILLDGNLVSKIGDVGLSTLLPPAAAPRKETAPVGTLGYLDPEYQRTGVISLKSDVYALGVVLLQLATGRGAVGLVPSAEVAVEEEGRLAEVLDPAAGPWPLEKARELLLLGLRCSALRQAERPDLHGEVLPALERLKSFALNSQKPSEGDASEPPGHFFCPILKEVMEDPCVAADGYTYDRRAIEIWLSMNQSSPITNQPLPSATLIPNQNILAAIEAWMSRDG